MLRHRWKNPLVNLARCQPTGQEKTFGKSVIQCANLDMLQRKS